MLHQAAGSWTSELRISARGGPQIWPGQQDEANITPNVMDASS